MGADQIHHTAKFQSSHQIQQLGEAAI